MRFLIAMAALLITLAAAQAQTVISGNGNGNGNSGTGSGNGNGNGNGNGIVTVMNSARGNTPSFAAPGLAAAGIESCMASVSAGGAGGGVAVTIAGPIVDKGCDIRLFARTLYALGYRQAATQILCNDPQAAAALAVEGVRCYVGIGAQIQNPPPPQPQLFGGIFNCRHYVLFQGCMDEPAPAVAAADVERAGATAVAENEPEAVPAPKPRPHHRRKLARNASQTAAN